MRQLYWLSGPLGQPPLGWHPPDGYPDVADLVAQRRRHPRALELPPRPGRRLVARRPEAPVARVAAAATSSHDVRRTRRRSGRRAGAAPADRRGPPRRRRFLGHAPGDRLRRRRRGARLAAALGVRPAARQPRGGCDERRGRRPSPAAMRPRRPAGLSRRRLLGAAAAAAAMGVVGGAVGDLASARYAFAGTDYTGDVLVVLSLRGGFDGLSAVVPAADPSYAVGPAGHRRPDRRAAAARRDLRAAPGARAAQAAVGRRAAGRRARGRPARPDPLALPGDGGDGAGGTRVQPAHRLARPGQLRAGCRQRRSPPSASASRRNQQALVGPAPALLMPGVDDFQLSSADSATERARWTKALAAMHAGARPDVAEPARLALARPRHRRRRCRTRLRDRRLPRRRPGAVAARRRAAGEGRRRPPRRHRRLRRLGHARRPRPGRRRLDGPPAGRARPGARGLRRRPRSRPGAGDAS